MSDKTAAYEKKRYRRDRKKRIAAETAYKEKKKSDPKFKAKVKARSKVRTKVRAGAQKAPARCPKCGRTGRMEFHHTNYKTGAGFWRCPRCNPRGGAAKGAKKG